MIFTGPGNPEGNRGGSAW